jgi:transposase
MAQRKVDDNIVLQLLREGKNQREIADHFQVSPVAICKRLKRILPKPQNLELLTPKEQKFVVAVAEGKSRTKAALESFDCTSRDSAKALQNTLMKKDDVKIAIAELMEIFGMNRPYRINKLKSHVDNADPGISLKALYQSFKLDGLDAPEKNLVNIIDYRAVVLEINAADAILKKQLEDLRAKEKAQEAVEEDTEKSEKEET